MARRDEAEFIGLLRKRLVDAGARHVRQRDDGADLTFEQDGTRFVVQARHSRDARTPILRSLLAEGLLEARALQRDGKTRALPIISAPSISDAIVAVLKEFADRVAPGQPWGLSDGRGRLEVYVDAAPAIALPPEEKRQAPARVQRRPALFSDVYQWLLKVLLAPALPSDLLTAPRGARIASTRDLARAAGVAVGSATHFLSAFEAEGHVERTRGGILVVRRRELLEAWRVAARPRTTPIGMSWVIAPGEVGDALRALLEQLARKSIPSGLAQHAACEALGFGFVHGVKPCVYIERFDGVALQQLGLILTEAGAAPDVFFDVPHASRSCFAGMVARNGVRATDVIQSWLDVGRHPARGQEQADLLWNEVLEPKLIADEVVA